MLHSELAGWVRELWGGNCVWKNMRLHTHSCSRTHVGESTLHPESHVHGIVLFLVSFRCSDVVPF